MISIVIPVWNQHEMTAACASSIHENTQDFELIIIDNGSDPAFQGATIRNDENFGFPVAVNQGIRAARGETIIVMNNDVIVTPGWADRLEHHLQKWDMVGPITNSISGPQQSLIDIYEDIQGLYEMARINQKIKAGRVTPYHRLVFFCVAIKRSVINKIGLLDEAFTPGNFEDDDYCLRAIEAGFKLGIANDVYVHHFGSVTHKAMNIEYEKLMKRNRAIFDRKWSAEKYSELSERGQQR